MLKINKKNNIIVKSDASFRFYSGKKVRVRPGCGKRAEKKRRFEMEELYMHKGKIYFNSEGSDNFLDLIGSFDN